MCTLWRVLFQHFYVYNFLILKVLSNHVLLISVGQVLHTKSSVSWHVNYTLQNA